MIKQIQLRGISRSPSDRMTEDGGLDESLNIYLDAAESAPALVPEDVTSELGLPEGLEAKRIFVHSVLAKKNYIVVDAENNILYRENTWSIPEDESIEDIASLGNTLVVSTDTNVYYFLYGVADDTYSYLGNNVPFPAMEVKAIGFEENPVTYEQFREKTYNQPNLDMAFGESAWNNWGEEDYLAYAKPVYDTLMRVLEGVQEKATKIGKYCRPILVRYAVRLYNGSQITSVPYLLSPQRIGGFKSIRGVYEWIENAGYDEDDKRYGEDVLTITYTAGSYSPQVKMIGFDAEEVKKWKDIILGIDIYFSTQIQTATDGIRAVNVEYEYGYGTADLELQSASKTDEELITEKSNFFKVASFDLNRESDVAILLEGKTFTKAFKDEELIDLLDPLNDNMLPDAIIPKKMTTFNNRIVSAGVAKKLSSGSQTLMSEYGEGWVEKWTMRFYINSSTGKGEVLARDVDGNPYIQGDAMMGWIVYPSAQCYKVVAWQAGNRVIEVEMKPHPWLDCAYAYLGRNRLLSYAKEDEQMVQDISTRSEHALISEYNKLYVSEMDNPMVFPTSGIHTISSGKVLGVAIATTTLSQGQFGQFPLYVFTEDGIWAMETAADGSFVTSKPLSRDVCVNPESITSIDNAVVFVSDKGVMLLQGSQVVNISPFMTGRHYTINQSAKDILEMSDYASLLPSLTDADTFMGFVKKASVAYDYAGKRLVFIARDEAYQYVYKLDTQTWHKLKHEVELIEPINSYPESLVRGKEEHHFISLYIEDVESRDDQTYELFKKAAKDTLNLTENQISRMWSGGSILLDLNKVSIDDVEGFIIAARHEAHVDVDYDEMENVNRTRVYDLSTILDGTREQSTELGCLITRPLDLGYADIKKVIKDIRIRGEFAKGHVQYILQGSDDGVNYFNTSLKQKSWKLFRIIIVCALDRFERISWIDIDYDIRYNNRLR